MIFLRIFINSAKLWRKFQRLAKRFFTYRLHNGSVRTICLWNLNEAKHTHTDTRIERWTMTIQVHCSELPQKSLFLLIYAKQERSGFFKLVVVSVVVSGDGCCCCVLRHAVATLTNDFFILLYALNVVP